MSKDFDLIRFFHDNTKRNIYYTTVPPDISTKPSTFKEYPDLPIVSLPKDFTLRMSIEKAILRRRSCRSFAHRSLSLAKLSKLLWFGYGVTEILLYEDFEIPGRPAPSAGALYPCEIYPIVFNVKGIEKGVYHYCPVDNSLELLKKGDFANRIAQLFMGQTYIARASVCLILSSILERITWKYGVRGYRYLLLEVGHIAQNLCLVAAAQNLAALPLGGFYDNHLANFIGVDPEHEPIQYGLAVGYEQKGKVDELQTH